MRQIRMLKPGSYPSCAGACSAAKPCRWAWREPGNRPHRIGVENLYGPTEATSPSPAYRLPRSHRRTDELQTVPIGTPLQVSRQWSSMTMASRCPDGEVGEILPRWFAGGERLLACAGRTAERFGAAVRRSGDLAGTAPAILRSMTREHGLVFRGRIDRQTKIRGYRVELLEVEMPCVSPREPIRSRVSPWPLDDGGLATASSALSRVRRRVPMNDRWMPRLVAALHGAEPDFPVDDWPLNPNGKTDYKPMNELLEKPAATHEQRPTHPQHGSRCFRRTCGYRPLSDGSIDPSTRCLKSD